MRRRRLWQETRRAKEETPVLASDCKKQQHLELHQAQEFSLAMRWQFAWEFELSDKVNEELT